jgi:hypothetical protein
MNADANERLPMNDNGNGPRPERNAIAEIVAAYMDYAREKRSARRSNRITPGMRITAMLAIVTIVCVIFTLVRDDSSAGLIYMFVGGGGIGAVCLTLFAGHDIV